MKSFDREIMVFMKDFSIKMVNEMDLPNPKEIKFMLVPIVGNDCAGYFYIKSKDMIRFSRAKIDFQFNIEFFSDALPSLILPQQENSFESSSLVETCNLLYSLYKYGMISSFENSYVREELPCELNVEPEYLYVKIYDKNDDEILDVKINSMMSSAEKNNAMDLMLNKIFKHMKHYLTIRNNQWNITEKKKLKEDDIIGLSSTYTKTLVFLEGREYIDICQSVSGFSVDMLIVDMNEYGPSILQGDLADKISMDSYQDISDTDIVPVKMVTYWEHDISDILNFVNLLKHYMFTLNELMIMVYRYLKINDNLEYRTIPSDMNPVPIVVINNELLSIKLRNYSDFFVGENIIGLSDYVSIIHDLIEYM